MPQPRAVLLLLSVFVVAVAGLVYELVVGTLSTYLLGASVLVFSLVIGLFLSAMGVGAWAAQYVRVDLVRAFIRAEIALAAVGGLSALALFWAFSALGDLYPVAVLIVSVATGALVGVEIPLLIRILEQRVEVRVAVSHVLALDYAGALVASVLFPLLLLPQLGLVRASALLGGMNLLVAAAALRLFRDELTDPAPLRRQSLAVGALLGLVGLGGGQATRWVEDQLYADQVLYAATTPYQRIVVTRWRDDWRLYLDGNLQFSSTDEHRYHESLVHVPMAYARGARRVLVLGGGDGLAVRELLRHPQVSSIDLVDLDPAVLDLFRDHPTLSALNDHSLRDPRLRTHTADALRFLEDADQRWDVILIDLPDPNDAALARLYSQGAYQLALRRLSDQGALVTQATSPFFARQSYWCIVRTLEAAVAADPIPREVRPYHVNVPSFGEWGFALVTARGAQPDMAALDRPLRFLRPDVLQALFVLPEDLGPVPAEVNRLENAVLATYYRRDWGRFNSP